MSARVDTQSPSCSALAVGCLVLTWAFPDQAALECVNTQQSQVSFPLPFSLDAMSRTSHYKCGAQQLEDTIAALASPHLVPSPDHIKPGQRTARCAQGARGGEERTAASRASALPLLKSRSCEIQDETPALYQECGFCNQVHSESAADVLRRGGPPFAPLRSHAGENTLGSRVWGLGSRADLGSRV
eukprot:3078777-Rhodomonas_salina.1